MKKFIAGLMAGLMLSVTGVVFAEGIVKTIEAKFGQVKVVVNGENLNKETLLYDGRTYLPLRETAEILDMEVDWNEKTSTASLTDSTYKTGGESKEKVSDNKIVKYGIGEKFIFDQWEIVFNEGIEWKTIDNHYSSLDGATVFAVPVSIKNTSDETRGFNMFSYTQYNPEGVELDGVGAYFTDDIGYFGNLRSGSSADAYMYFLYDSNGEYHVEFGYLNTEIEVKLVVNK